jgi:hypothetical protein
MRRLDDTGPALTSIGEAFGGLVSHASYRVLPHQVIMDVRVVHMILDSLDWKIRIHGVIVRNLRNECWQNAARNSLGPVFKQPRWRNPTSQKHWQGRSIHEGISTWTQDSLDLVVFWSWVIVESELVYIITKFNT